LNTKRLEGFKDSTTISKKPGDDENNTYFSFALELFALFPLETFLLDRLRFKRRSGTDVLHIGVKELDGTLHGGAEVVRDVMVVPFVLV
jgi:hypothetical protein